MRRLRPSRDRRARPATADGLPALRAENVTVRFEGLTANDAICLEVEEGGITGLIGPNGAGKTTFFNVATGALQPNGGTVWLGSHDITRCGATARARLGMARTFQSVQLVAALSVRENVMVGASRFVRSSPVEALAGVGRATADEECVRAITDRALSFTGLSEAAPWPATELPYGLRRRVEVARALAAGPRILLLDEPSSGMDPVETRALAELIRAIAGLGITVLLVEHDMALVREVVQHLYVLNFGTVIAAGEPGPTLEHPEVVKAYLGSRAAAGDA